jgi:hypothetical protein
MVPGIYQKGITYICVIVHNQINIKNVHHANISFFSFTDMSCQTVQLTQRMVSTRYAIEMLLNLALKLLI